MERDEERPITKKEYSALVCAVCGIVLFLIACGAAIYKLARLLKIC